MLSKLYGRSDIGALTCIAKPAAVIVAIMAIGLTACSSGGGIDGGTVAVTSTSPVHDATGIAVSSAVSASFNQPMNAATLNTTTFTLAGPVGPVTGAVNYSGTTASFTSTSPLAYGGSYTAVLDNTVRSASGLALSGGYAWSFQTVGAVTTAKQICVSEIGGNCTVPDNDLLQCLHDAQAVGYTQPCTDFLAEIPWVMGHTPGTNGAAAVNTAITASFSKPMAASTIDVTTFTLTAPGSAVGGEVTYSGTTATFTPSSALDLNTTYTATITTGARDANGNALAKNYSWSFSTALFMNVDGGACVVVTPTPGCTFNVSNGTRVTVTQDAHYNRYGSGTNDMWYVQFDSIGTASVFNNAGVFQYYANTSEFAGHVAGSVIGVGTTGTYWENVAGRAYWFGSNGVLYSANSGNPNFGAAIN